MKNNRLFGIIYLLLSKDTLTAKELANYFEVSVRTIYRDIELLSSFHIPIYMSQGKNGGIHLLDNYKLDKTLLTEEEQNQILFALESLEKLSRSPNSVFSKMQAIFQKNSNDWIQIDFSDWKSPQNNNQTFSKIKESILKYKKLKFTYYNSYEQRQERTVEPLQLHFKHNAWYILCYEEAKHDYRFFKLNRIKNLSLLEDTFERELPEEEYKPKQEIKIISLTLEISRKQAYRVYDEFEEQDIHILENGNFLVRVEYPESDWIYGYILSFGEHIKVMEPAYVKEIIKKKLESSLQNYD